MSYVDEVYELVVAKNPAQPEFHQAVKEVLESLRVVIEADEDSACSLTARSALTREAYVSILP